MPQPQPQPQVLLTGLECGESPRWHDGRLWLANWGTREIVAVDREGRHEVVMRVPTTLPFSIDWLPDGRLLVVSGPECLLLRLATDGSLVTHGNLTGLDRVYNEIVVDGRGNAYVDGIGFDLMAGAPFAPGGIVLVSPDGSAVRQVAEGLAFGNGMAVTPDNTTLIVAESYASRLSAFDIAADGSLTNRRVWADLDGGVPDGICLDAEGAVWFADVPNQCCTRVREGGEVLHRIALDRGCFACMLGGADGTTLFLLAAEWRGPEHMADGARTGQVLTAQAPAPAAGWPASA